MKCQGTGLPEGWKIHRFIVTKDIMASNHNGSRSVLVFETLGEELVVKKLHRYYLTVHDILEPQNGQEGEYL